VTGAVPELPATIYVPSAKQEPSASTDVSFYVLKFAGAAMGLQL